VFTCDVYILLINGCLHSVGSVKCQQKLSWHREGGFDGMQISAFMIRLLTFNFVTQLPRFDILVICIIAVLLCDALWLHNAYSY